MSLYQVMAGNAVGRFSRVRMRLRGSCDPARVARAAVSPLVVSLRALRALETSNVCAACAPSRSRLVAAPRRARFALARPGAHLMRQSRGAHSRPARRAAPVARARRCPPGLCHAPRLLSRALRPLAVAPLRGGFAALDRGFLARGGALRAPRCPPRLFALAPPRARGLTRRFAALFYGFCPGRAFFPASAVSA